MQFSSCLERYQFEKYVLDVSIATLQRGGVTSKIDTYQFLTPVDAWGLPKYPAKTVVLEPGVHFKEALTNFIEENEACLREPDAWLGTWIHPITQCCHIDITLICPDLELAKTEALRRGRREARTIIAVYNFLHNQTIFL